MSAVAFLPSPLAAPFPSQSWFPSYAWQPDNSINLAPVRRLEMSAVPSPNLAGAYGAQNIGVQPYLPVNTKRSFTWLEKENIAKGLQRWWPKLFSSYATPTYQLLASPFKFAALIAAGVAALVGGAVATSGERTLGLGTGVVIGALVAGFSYFVRNQKNENILDLMARFPEGATQRDILSDPVYQKDQDRQELTSAILKSSGSVLTPRYNSGSEVSSSRFTRNAASLGASFISSRMNMSARNNGKTGKALSKVSRTITIRPSGGK